MGSDYTNQNGDMFNTLPKLVLTILSNRISPQWGYFQTAGFDSQKKRKQLYMPTVLPLNIIERLACNAHDDRDYFAMAASTCSLKDSLLQPFNMYNYMNNRFDGDNVALLMHLIRHYEDRPICKIVLDHCMDRLVADLDYDNCLAILRNPFCSAGLRVRLVSEMPGQSMVQELLDFIIEQDMEDVLVQAQSIGLVKVADFKGQVEKLISLQTFKVLSTLFYQGLQVEDKEYCLSLMPTDIQGFHAGLVRHYLLK